MAGWGIGKLQRSALATAAIGLLLFAPGLAGAQTRNLLAPQSTASVPVNPGPGSPGDSIVNPTPLMPPAPLTPSNMPLNVPPMAQASPIVPAGHVALALAARYGRDAPAISSGVIWR